MKSILGAMIQSRHFFPRGELWFVDPNKGIVGKIVNIGEPQPELNIGEPQPELNIGDWPWPEPKKGKR